MTFGKTFAALLVLLILIGGSSIASAHEGEEIEDNQGPPVYFGQINTRVATTESIALLVKYQTPKFSEETPVQIFLTDLKTNAPVTDVSVALSFNPSNRVTATSTDTPGVYQALVTFPSPGKYSISLRLAGSKINSLVSIPGVIVPEKAVKEPVSMRRIGSIGSLALLLILLIATKKKSLRALRLLRG